MAKKKDCNCKGKKNVDKLIKNIEDINKSSSVNKSKGNKTIIKIIFNTVKVIVYFLLGILVVIGAVPILLYILFNKKQIVIKLPKLIKNG